MSASSPIFQLHFDGGVARYHVLPASALVQALTGLQRAIYLLGMAAEGYEVSQRAWVSQAVEGRYSVVCQLSREGGYIQPYTIGDYGHSLFDQEFVAKVVAGHDAVLDAIQNGSQEALRTAVPDGYYRRNILQAIRVMQPPERSGLILHIEDGTGRVLVDGTPR